MRHRAADLGRRRILAQALVNHLPQQIIVGPRQKLEKILATRQRRTMNDMLAEALRVICSPNMASWSPEALTTDRQQLANRPGAIFASNFGDPLEWTSDSAVHR